MGSCWPWEVFEGSGAQNQPSASETDLSGARIGGLVCSKTVKTQSRAWIAEKQETKFAEIDGSKCWVRGTEANLRCLCDILMPLSKISEKVHHSWNVGHLFQTY